MTVKEMCPACTEPPLGSCSGFHSFHVEGQWVSLPVAEGRRLVAEKRIQGVSLPVAEKQTQQVALKCLALVAALVVARALYGYGRR